MESGKQWTSRRVADRGKVDFAREQRREPTPGERILWQALRGKKLGVKFRRQHPIEDFVLDFYCAEVRLAIEVDGASHEGQEGYDAWRDGVLASWGIRVLRFSESQVHDDLSDVLREIRTAVDD